MPTCASSCAASACKGGRGSARAGPLLSLAGPCLPAQQQRRSHASGLLQCGAPRGRLLLCPRRGSSAHDATHTTPCARGRGGHKGLHAKLGERVRGGAKGGTRLESGGGGAAAPQPSLQHPAPMGTHLLLHKGACNHGSCEGSGRAGGEVRSGVSGAPLLGGVCCPAVDRRMSDLGCLMARWRGGGGWGEDANCCC